MPFCDISGQKVKDPKAFVFRMFFQTFIENLNLKNVWKEYAVFVIHYFLKNAIALELEVKV
jgi:hypothetical protein